MNKKQLVALFKDLGAYSAAKLLAKGQVEWKGEALFAVYFKEYTDLAQFINDLWPIILDHGVDITLYEDSYGVMVDLWGEDDVDEKSALRVTQLLKSLSVDDR